MLTRWGVFVIDGERLVYFSLMQREVSSFPLVSFPMHWICVIGIVQLIGYVSDVVVGTQSDVRWTDNRRPQSTGSVLDRSSGISG